MQRETRDVNKTYYLLSVVQIIGYFPPKGVKEKYLVLTSPEFLIKYVYNSKHIGKKRKELCLLRVIVKIVICLKILLITCT